MSRCREFCDREIVDVFSDKLAKAAGKLKIGDPTEPETDVGPLISQKECQRVALGQEAVESGATLKTGGETVRHLL